MGRCKYLHYQSSLELKQPKGRRDGNRYNEASNYSLSNNSDLAKQNRLKGVQSFQKAIRVWESLDSTNQEQKAERDRYRNEYIKSLYSSGSAIEVC
jgi:hypothetical protein